MNDIIECCEDKNYARFLSFIKKKLSYYSVSNIGTILSKVPDYANFEQIFSAGIDDIIDSKNFALTINEIPKSLIKIAKSRKIKVSQSFCRYWKEQPDAHYLAYQLNYNSLTDEDIEILLGCDCYHYPKVSYFNELLNKYSYNAKALLLYIDELVTYEAIDNVEFIIKELTDYACMMNSISDKYDKYPRHFLTTHKIACRNYNRLKKQFEEELFQKQIVNDYECTFGDYTFIYPKSTQEIKEEAVSQNNCVASYIDRVIDGKCHIIFLRKKDKPKDSLVTIEVRNNKIVQARRRFNYPVTDEEREVINKWNKKFGSLENERTIA